MSMTEDKDIRRVPGEQLFRGGASDLVAVADVNGQPLQFEGEVRLQIRIAATVRVSVNGLNGGDDAQLVENALSPDIPGMEYQRDAIQCVEQFRPDEAVRIGDEADEHRVSLPCRTSHFTRQTSTHPVNREGERRVP